MAGEEQDAHRKQQESERLMAAARAKMREADDIAKRYWEVREGFGGGGVLVGVCAVMLTTSPSATGR